MIVSDLVATVSKCLTFSMLQLRAPVGMLRLPSLMCVCVRVCHERLAPGGLTLALRACIRYDVALGLLLPTLDNSHVWFPFPVTEAGQSQSMRPASLLVAKHRAHEPPHLHHPPLDDAMAKMALQGGGLLETQRKVRGIGTKRLRHEQAGNQAEGKHCPACGGPRKLARPWAKMAMDCTKKPRTFFAWPRRNVEGNDGSGITARKRRAHHHNMS